MNLKMSIRNSEGICVDYREIWKSVKQRKRFETCWTLPKDIGTGSFWKIELRPEFDLYIADYELQERLVTNVDRCRPAFGFGFSVLGETKGKTYGMKDEIVMGSGQSQLAYFPDHSGSVEDAKNRRRLSVSLMIEPHLFYTLTKGEFDRMPADFRSIADGTEEKNYYRTSTITPAMQAALHQILNCPYHGLTRRLYLESKALELIAHKLEQLMSAESEVNRKFPLRPDDIERIHYAREVISRDLENPPTLFELARLVGLTHTKLNRGFREIYGTTVFGYLRKIRLNQAKLLLEENGMNVTEVALSVGYNSLSSFIHAFSDHFGIKPSLCIKYTL
jgi:AraC-like DNA-binding protein